MFARAKVLGCRSPCDYPKFSHLSHSGAQRPMQENLCGRARLCKNPWTSSPVSCCILTYIESELKSGLQTSVGYWRGYSYNYVPEDKKFEKIFLFEGFNVATTLDAPERCDTCFDKTSREARDTGKNSIIEIYTILLIFVCSWKPYLEKRYMQWRWRENPIV